MNDGRSSGLEIDAVVEAAGWGELLGLDPEALAERAIETCAHHERVTGAVSVLFADDAALQALNRQWRSKDVPTNVLSFPAAEGAQALATLGDIALALETVSREAEAQGKTAAAHTTHLIVHGFLHLLGYDHVTDEEALEMEAREREILASLGVADPYADETRAAGAAS